jgi:hypothetical protein
MLAMQGQRMERPWSMGLLACIAAGSAWHAIAAASATVVPDQVWSGRVALEARPPLQTSIARAADWNRVWRACHLQGAPPRVDFTRQLGLVAVRRGNEVKFATMNTVDGDLRTNVEVSPGTPPHLTCAIALVPRQGIRTVNGAPAGQ